MALENAIQKIITDAGIPRAAVAVYDYESGEEVGYAADTYFHAASTIKLAILLVVFKAAESGRLKLDDLLHVRNRFLSVADGQPFRLERGRDADEETYQRIGRNMRVEQLLRQMITVSSNLATNLLLNYVGLDWAQNAINDAGIEGVQLKRGVEDTAAHEKGINNEVTASGLVKILRVIQDATWIGPDSRDRILKILFDQKFNAMIPKKLPSGVRVAHKTGEISTCCHDAGLIFYEDRKPYALAILTEVAPDKSIQHGPVADISEAVFAALRKK